MSPCMPEFGSPQSSPVHFEGVRVVTHAQGGEEIEQVAVHRVGEQPSQEPDALVELREGVTIEQSSSAPMPKTSNVKPLASKLGQQGPLQTVICYY